MRPQDHATRHRRPKRPERAPSLLRSLVAIIFATACLGANAERADRDKPVNIEADRVEIDDQKKVAVFEGNVVLTQGTLMLKANRIIVNQDESGFQSGIAYGSPAYFRQKREGYDDYIEGWAERLEYDGQNEKVELFDKAKLKREGDEVRGNYISYNALTEFFEVMGSGPGATAGTSSGRVRAIIQPRTESDGNTPKSSPGTPGKKNGASR
jgi:lipopolysaccharide export system protein LptA